MLLHQIKFHRAPSLTAADSSYQGKTRWTTKQAGPFMQIPLSAPFNTEIARVGCDQLLNTVLASFAEGFLSGRKELWVEKKNSVIGFPAMRQHVWQMRRKLSCNLNKHYLKLVSFGKRFSSCAGRYCRRLTAPTRRESSVTQIALRPLGATSPTCKHVHGHINGHWHHRGGQSFLAPSQWIT